MSPYFSPDGEKIVFYSDRNGSWDVYLIEPDGNNEENLISGIFNDLSANWSPDRWYYFAWARR